MKHQNILDSSTKLITYWLHFECDQSAAQTSCPHNTHFTLCSRRLEFTIHWTCFQTQFLFDSLDGAGACLVFCRLCAWSVNMMHFYWLIQVKHVSTKATLHTTEHQGQTENPDPPPGGDASTLAVLIGQAGMNKFFVKSHCSLFLYVFFNNALCFRKLPGWAWC